MTTIAQQLNSKTNEARNGRQDARLLTDRHDARSTVQRNQRRNDAGRDNNYNPEQRGYRPNQGRNREQTNRAPIADGHDHINLWSSGKTDLGRLLAMEHAHFMKVKKYGEFSSVLALYTYLTTKDHPFRLRRAPSRTLISWITERRESGLEIDFPNIEFICAEAIAGVITASPSLKKALIDTGNVPIDAYRETHSYTRRTRRDQWWAAAIRLIRTQLQAEQEIDMTPLLVEGDAESAYIDLIHEKPMLGRVEGYVAPSHNARAQQQNRHPKPQNQPRQQRQRPQVGNPGDFEQPPKTYYVVFINEEERQKGLAHLRGLTAVDLLETLMGAEPGVPVEAKPAEPHDDDVYYHGVYLLVGADGQLMESNADVWFGPTAEAAAPVVTDQGFDSAEEPGFQALDAMPEMDGHKAQGDDPSPPAAETAGDLVYMDGTGIMNADGQEVMALSNGRTGEVIDTGVLNADGTFTAIASKNDLVAGIQRHLEENPNDPTLQSLAAGLELTGALENVRQDAIEHGGVQMVSTAGVEYVKEETPAVAEGEVSESPSESLAGTQESAEPQPASADQLSALSERFGK